MPTLRLYVHKRHHNMWLLVSISDCSWERWVGFHLLSQASCSLHSPFLGFALCEADAGRLQVHLKPLSSWTDSVHLGFNIGTPMESSAYVSSPLSKETNIQVCLCNILLKHTVALTKVVRVLWDSENIEWALVMVSYFLTFSLQWMSATHRDT